MADDVLADMQNIMGYQGLVGPNPYLQYQGAIPMPGYNTTSPFTGPVVMGPQDLLPTNAEGQPIQPPYGTTPYQPPPPGTTLNTAPPQNNALQWAQQNSLLNQEKANLINAGAGNSPELENLQLQSIANAQQYGGPYYDQARLQALQGNPNMTLGQLAAVQPNLVQGNMPIQMPGGGTFGGGPTPYQQQFNAQQAAQNSAPTGTPQTGLNRQQYLSLLSNPGPVPTYGAAGPQPGQAATGQGQVPSVMQAFLAAHPSGGATGAGGYSNQGFFNTLAQLSGGSSGGGAGATPSAGASSGGGFANLPLVGGGSGLTMGNTLAPSWGGAGSPPAGTPGAPKDIATQGYLSASGAPISGPGTLMDAARGLYGGAQQKIMSGGI